MVVGGHKFPLCADVICWKRVRVAVDAARRVLKLLDVSVITGVICVVATIRVLLLILLSCNTM